VFEPSILSTDDRSADAEHEFDSNVDPGADAEHDVDTCPGFQADGPDGRNTVGSHGHTAG
jgi:hypothetical protein